jgi:hypothetical protein
VKKPLDLYKQKYYQIKSIFCVVLKEKVYFNNYGFNHLIRKRGVKRFFWDIKRRFKLLIFVEEILVSIDVRVDYRKGNIKYWAISKTLGKRKLKIVLRKIKRGKLHFYSIYEE